MPGFVPVLMQVSPEVVPFDLWPVTATDDSAWVDLHGAMTPGEVGMAVLALVFHNYPGRKWRLPKSAEEALDWLILRRDLRGQGGLLLSDPDSGVVAEPSGCGDLDDWRAWLKALDGIPFDLGCPPAPAVEYVGGTVRVWACLEDDCDRAATRAGGSPPRIGCTPESAQVSVPAGQRLEAEAEGFEPPVP